MANVNEILNSSQMANAKWGKQVPDQIPIAQVDSLADELVREYGNPQWRRWYCGVIYEYGVSRVEDWRARAREAAHPGKVFTAYVNQARGRAKGDGSAQS